MAIKKVCDGCGIDSPDSHGLFIANHWVTVKVHVPFAFAGMFNRDYEWMLCRPCANKGVDAVFGPQSYEKSIMEARP